jgi:hypothetical protein
MRLEVEIPKGYAPSDEEGALIVARTDVWEDVIQAYRAAPRPSRSLHGFAASVPQARRYRGRDVAYGISLPIAGLPAVVRHNRHGGAFRAVTADLFVAPTRAPDELEMSLALAQRDVPTPPVLAYAVYPAMFGLARADVVTEEISEGLDLGALLLATRQLDSDREAGWDAALKLLTMLSRSGARHHDLNVKNILLRRAEIGFTAYVLDVDRVELDWPAEDALRKNAARLVRSVEKWRDTRGAQISVEEIEILRRIVSSTP